MSKPKGVSLLRIMHLMRRLYPYTERFKQQIVWIFAALLLTALLQLPSAFLFKIVIDNILPQHDDRLLVIIVSAMVSVSVLASIINIFSYYIFNRIGYRLATNLRKAMFRHYLELPFRHYLEEATGKKVNRLVTETNDVAGFFMQSLWVLPMPLLTVGIGSSIMMFWNWKMALYILVSIPLTIVLTKRLSKALRKIHQLGRDHQEGFQGKVSEAIDNIRVIRAFTREDKLERELNHEVDTLSGYNRKNHFLGSCLRSTNKIIDIAFQYLFIVFGAYMVIDQQISLGEFFAFKFFQESMSPSVNALFNFLTELPNRSVSIERALAVLDLEREKGLEQKRQRKKLDGKIVFEHVSLTYPDGTQALHDISFHVDPGETLALIGPSGSGKSSITSLLLGLYPISAGRIIIDDVEHPDWNIRELRRHIGMIFQDSQLFQRSVRANLQVAKPEIGDEEIWKALEAAQAKDFIRETSDGLDSQIGSKGIKLSGGQRQRLTIARALLKDPSLLIMDEATSALDSISEKAIQKAMTEITKDRTTLIIAHRLSTIAHADRILVMDEGRIRESGTHNELLKAGGLYADLYSSQMDGFIQWERRKSVG